MSCNNTNSTCSNCSNNYSSCNNKCNKCGCKDSFLTSPPPCPTPAGCPDPIPCQEVLSSDCIIYNGPDLLCNEDIVVYNDDTLTEILEQIIEYFCLPPIPEITCNGDIVVDYDSSINEALEDIVDYFCVPPIPEITCNGDIVVTEDSSINEALEDIVSYFCLPPIPEITCNEDIVVAEDSSINEALEDIVSYFCLTPIPLILCGADSVVQQDSSINQALEDIVSYFCDHLTTANNGLTMSPTLNNVQLGGPLIQNTTITNSTFNLNINSTTVSALTLFKSIGNNLPTLMINDPSVSTTSPAIQAFSNRFGFTNSAVFFENRSTNISGGQVLTLKSQNNSINTVSPQSTTPALYIESSKTASTTTQVALRVDNVNNINAGSGIAIEFANSEATPGLGFITNRLISKTVVNTSESLMTSEFVIQGKPSGTIDPVDHLTLKSTGQLQLNNYGAGLITGVPTYTLSTTASGDIIETIPGLGPAGPAGPAGTNGTNAFKYIYEKLSVFDGEIFTILRTDLEACGLIPVGCFDPRLVSETCDLHVRLYFQGTTGFWFSIPERFSFGSPSTQGYELKINATTGDIVITLSIAPIDPPARVRVVILA